MHEMSIAESVLQILEEKAPVEGYSRVKVVWLEVGQLAGVEPESLRFCFDAVTRESIAGDARLEIIETPGQGRCLECCSTVAISTVLDPCPHCGSLQVEVTGGNEMRVRELEVE
jgi:hydrogenase nickel incorporation protein HypA/HybF